MATSVDQLDDLPWQDQHEPPRRARPRRKKRGFFSTLVGVIGELMITAGILLGLFVVWQLWWTDVEAHSFQAEVLQEWRAQENVVEAPVQVAEKRTDAPPTPSAVAEGESLGNLYVPRINGSERLATIAHGVGMNDVLNKGYIGHYPDTQLPGEIGNFATAAHRQSYGAPYKQIEQIVPGDSLIVETTNAYIVYEVVSDEIVHPSQVEVIGPVPNEPGVVPTERMITLTTCHPLYSAAQRWITYGEFSYWIDKEEGMPDELMGEDA